MTALQKVIDLWRDGCASCDGAECKKGLDEIMLAVDKQTAMPVDRKTISANYNTAWSNYKCPACGAHIGSGITPPVYNKYCFRCGQKLEW